MANTFLTVAELKDAVTKLLQIAMEATLITVAAGRDDKAMIRKAVQDTCSKVADNFGSQDEIFEWATKLIEHFGLPLELIVHPAPEGVDADAKPVLIH
jgi:hypothetical protein